MPNASLKLGRLVGCQATAQYFLPNEQRTAGNNSNDPLQCSVCAGHAEFVLGTSNQKCTNNHAAGHTTNLIWVDQCRLLTHACYHSHHHIIARPQGQQNFDSQTSMGQADGSHTWVKNDTPGLNASINSFLCLLLHLLTHFPACVLILSVLLHGLRRPSHVHQDIGHIQLCNLQTAGLTQQIVRPAPGDDQQVC